eukprot:jgi/Chlat1/5792/Chrsp387S05511
MWFTRRLCAQAFLCCLVCYGASMFLVSAPHLLGQQSGSALAIKGTLGDVDSAIRISHAAAESAVLRKVQHKQRARAEKRLAAVDLERRLHSSLDSDAERDDAAEAVVRRKPRRISTYMESVADSDREHKRNGHAAGKLGRGESVLMPIHNATTF